MQNLREQYRQENIDLDEEDCGFGFPLEGSTFGTGCFTSKLWILLGSAINGFRDKEGKGFTVVIECKKAKTERRVRGLYVHEHLREYLLLMIMGSLSFFWGVLVQGVLSSSEICTAIAVSLISTNEYELSVLRSHLK